MTNKTTGISLLIPLLLSLSMPVWADTTDTVPETETTTLSTTAAATDFIGSWSITLNNNNTQTPALFSFLQGGVLLQSESPMVDPMLGNLVFSNAHGSWSYDAADSSYKIRYFKLVYQADGAFWGREETIGTLHINDKGELSGDIRIGNQVSGISGTRIATHPDKDREANN